MTLSEFDNEIRKDYNVVCGCDEAVQRIEGILSDIDAQIGQDGM